MDRNKNLDIIDLLQDLKEKINIQDVEWYLLVYPTERTRHGEKKWLVVHNIWPTMKHGGGQLIRKCNTKEEAVEVANKLKDDKTEIVISDVIETGWPETKIDVKESIGDINYSSLSDTDLKNKLEGLKVKLHYFTGNSSVKIYVQEYIEAIEKELQKREASVEVEEATKVPQTMQPKEELENNPESVDMKDGEVSDKSKDRVDVIKEIPDKDLEKLPTQEKRQLMLCNSCCKVFRSNESVCIHCKSTLVEAISQDVSKKDEAIQKDSKIKEYTDAMKTNVDVKNFDKEKKEHPDFTDEQIWQIVKDHMKKNEFKVKEAEDSDTLQIVSRGIVDKVTADKLAAEQKGMVVADDVDKVKFMVIRKGK